MARHPLDPPGVAESKIPANDDDGHWKAGEYIKLEPDGALYIYFCMSHPDSERGFVRQSCEGRNSIWNLEGDKLTLEAYYLGRFDCKVYTVSLSVRYTLAGKFQPNRSIVCNDFPGTECPVLDDEGNRVATSYCSGGIWTLVDR